MYNLFKPFLFLVDPEEAHRLTMRTLTNALKIPGMRAAFEKTFCKDDPSLHRSVAGLKFKNPVGLAAGFDKDGKYFHQMALLGFSGKPAI